MFLMGDGDLVGLPRWEIDAGSASERERTSKKESSNSGESEDEQSVYTGIGPIDTVAGVFEFSQSSGFASKVNTLI